MKAAKTLEFATKVAQKIHSSVFPFSIVGIGASAGGLEDPEQFISHVPEKSGIAFIIVRHIPYAPWGIASTVW